MTLNLQSLQEHCTPVGAWQPGSGAHWVTLLPAFTCAADEDARGEPSLGGPHPIRPYRKLKSFLFF